MENWSMEKFENFGNFFSKSLILAVLCTVLGVFPVSMVKLDNFPVLSTKKTGKTKFCRKKSQKSHLAFKLFFYLTNVIT
jgi:hypothetical protein